MLVKSLQELPELNESLKDVQKAKEEKVNMYYWGSKGNSITLEPTPFKGIFGLAIKQIACGNKHIAILTETGTVYTEGEGTYGALGLPHLKKDTTTLSLVPQLKNINIKEIACGATFTVALSDVGNVYIWGTLKWSSHFLLPCRVKSLERVFITKIACGGHHILALSKGGRVYSWGRNDWNQLGRDTTISSNAIPTKIKGLKLVESISCGALHSLAVTTMGKLFVWGNNVDERSSPIHPDAIIPTPADITINIGTGDSIKKAIAGPYNTWVLTKNSKIRRWGPFLDKRHMAKYVSLQDDNGKPIPIADIEVGNRHCLILTENGEVYSFGLSTYGQTGQGTTETVEEPKRIAMLTQRMTSISSRGDFCFCFSGIMKSLLGENLLSIFNSQSSFPDVVFHFKDNKKIYAHACILAARSSVFKNQLLDIKTKYPDKGLIDIEITTHPYELFIDMLKFIYSDRIDFSDIEKISPLSIEYEIPMLNAYVQLLRREISSVPDSTFHDDFVKALLPEDSTITKLFGNVSFILQEQHITTHKVFLVARFEYFKTMFEHGMIESQTNLIQLSGHGATTEAVHAMLQFLYSDKLDIDVNVALALIPLATQYHLSRCKSLCENIIEKEVDVESVAYVYQVSRFYGATRLQGFCLKIIQEDIVDVKKSESWKMLSEEEIREINLNNFN
uniref:BTB domain-containing protein n=2 Tax=Arcella intermedia TaxID=1963864 RepID=A0A6B2KZ23_9EUKA